VGDLYAVISKSDQNLQLWLTEDPGGWDLRFKFGWFQHKRARPIPSASHDIVLLKENVVLDPKLHQHLEPFSPSAEARKLRVARLDAEVQSNLGSLYVVHDRLQCRVKQQFVPQGFEQQFHLANPGGEFERIHLAAKNVWLRNIEKVKGTQEFAGASGLPIFSPATRDQAGSAS
jgi:hypothetical protein